VLEEIQFKKSSQDEIVKMIPGLIEEYKGIKTSRNDGAEVNWIMGKLREKALGIVSMKELMGLINPQTP
jgi:hypothetical protein